MPTGPRCPQIRFIWSAPFHCARIEHVFDSLSRVAEGGSSAVDEALRRRIEEISGRRVWIIDFEPHGHRFAVPETAEAPVVGVAAPADPAVEAPGVDEDLPALAGFRALLETGAGHLTAARAARVESCRQAAVQARELAAFARFRPAAVLDRPDEQIGAAAAASRAARPAVLTAVSEWAVDEVMAAFALSARAAGQLLADAVTLAEALPATLDALAAAVIDWPSARMLAEVLAPLAAPLRGEVEARLLAGAAGRTTAQLRESARRAVLRADAAAAVARAAQAVRDRAVRVHAAEDGMATLAATMTGPVAAACRAALEASAAGCAVPGEQRTTAQRMVDCLADLILRPGVNGPVRIQLTVIATAGTLAGGDEPGEVEGAPVPAGMVRELAYALDLLPRPEPPDPEPTDPEPADPDPAPAPGRVAGLGRATPGLGALLNRRTVAGTALARPPAIAVVEALSGQLLALSDAAEIRRIATCGHARCRTGKRPCTHPPSGPGLGPPADTAGYAPAAPLTSFVRARDRRCRFPGCRARAHRCDLDHTTPWPQGSTSADNLCCLCRHHHRLRHQAPGWSLRHLPDGGLEWTTPGGETITTYPARYGTDEPPPTNGPPPLDPPLTADERVLGRPLPPGLADDPAPF
jgi:Domain of unknown function (DUF222)